MTRQFDNPTNMDVVFGTEVPRVVINEAYCEYENDPRIEPATVTVCAKALLVQLLGRAAEPASEPGRRRVLDPATRTPHRHGAGFPRRSSYPIYKLDVTNRNSGCAPSPIRDREIQSETGATRCFRRYLAHVPRRTGRGDRQRIG